MQVTLRIALVIYAVVLFIVVTHLLKKEKLPERYTIIWYAFSLVILLVGIVPQFLEIISKAVLVSFWNVVIPVYSFKVDSITNGVEELP